jgi:hypothetical protein
MTKKKLKLKPKKLQLNKHKLKPKNQKPKVKLEDIEEVEEDTKNDQFNFFNKSF